MPGLLTEEQGKKLINLARESIESSFKDEEVDLKKYSEFSEQRGVFVTLKKEGRLRGCIGFPEPIYPLSKAISDAARSAAMDDPRFPEMDKSELQDIKIEVSVLTLPEQITADDKEDMPQQVNIGKDGLIVRGPMASGLLLPQVFPEWNADGLKALEMTCEKAGLKSDCWKDDKYRIFKFHAQVFEE